MFTAEEYRTAAKVAWSSATDWAKLWEAEADKQEVQQKYAMTLGWIGRADAPDVRGMMLFTKLLEDGWTPPEGLF